MIVIIIIIDLCCNARRVQWYWVPTIKQMYPEISVENQMEQQFSE